MASRALITERNAMEVRIAELERRNTELEDQIHRGSDPLELRLQQLAEESSQLQKKLRVSCVTENNIQNCRARKLNIFGQRKIL